MLAEAARSLATLPEPFGFRSNPARARTAVTAAAQHSVSGAWASAALPFLSFCWSPRLGVGFFSGFFFSLKLPCAIERPG